MPNKMIPEVDALKIGMLIERQQKMSLQIEQLRAESVKVNQSLGEIAMRNGVSGNVRIITDDGDLPVGTVCDGSTGLPIQVEDETPRLAVVREAQSE